MKPKKAPHWFKQLSAAVRAAVTADMMRGGYDPAKEEEQDSYIVDMFATALRSPQGHILRLKRPVADAKPDTGDQGELFDLPAAPPVPAKVPCALCDRGDGQLGHADGCPKGHAN